MTYRKSPRKAEAKRQWDRFVSSNQPIITETGLPAAVFSSNALVTLAESYFAAGYEWFTPSALRPADQETLRQRFEN